jgi:hypothetical protein
MGYSNDDEMVRVDFFKESGKWYCTEAVKWTGPYHSKDNTGKVHLLYDVFELLLLEHLTDTTSGRIRYVGMTAVCLEPYHEHGHPLMMKVSDKSARY